MTTILRPYQAAAVQAMFDYFGAGNNGHPLIVMPTGTGKSVVLSSIVQQAFEGFFSIRVLMLTHSRELIAQNAATMLRIWPKAPLGIYSAGLGKRDIGAQVLFAGIQSIYKRAFQLQRVDLVLIDEAHLLSKNDGGMYRKLIGDLLQINQNLKVCGLTATPYRMDTGLLHEGDGALFTDIAYEVPILDMLAQGYLAPIVPKATHTTLDTTGVGTRSGEFIAGELEAAVDVAEITGAAVREIVARGADRRSWLAFCAGVKHARHVRDALRGYGITCETVTGDTPSGERDAILKAFKTGSLRCITNANCLTTGFDAPATDLIAMLRPTKSKGLFVQMLGRGTRPVYAPGFDLDTNEGRLCAIAGGAKRDCLVLDFAGNTQRMGPLDLIDGRVDVGGGGLAPTKTCPDCETILHTSVRFCPHCSYAFPEPKPKIEAVAAVAPVLSTQIKPEWVDVASVDYSLHHRDPEKPPTMKVTYRCGFQFFPEWVCLEHPRGSYPRVKAEQWWRRRVVGDTPATVAEALERKHELPTVTSIQIKPNGKFTEICAVRFARQMEPA